MAKKKRLRRDARACLVFGDLHVDNMETQNYDLLAAASRILAQPEIEEPPLKSVRVCRCKAHIMGEVNESEERCEACVFGCKP